MSLSAAKLAANRANAQKSTGPRTAEGKENSKRNAVKHGLSAKELIIKQGEHEEFQLFHDSLLESACPADPVQWILFNELVRAAWNLRRINQLEADLFDGVTDPLADENQDARMDRLARYRASNERTFHRALRELKALETEHTVRATYESVTSQPMRCLVDMGKVYKRTQEIHRDARNAGLSDPTMEEIDAFHERMMSQLAAGGPPRM